MKRLYADAGALRATLQVGLELNLMFKQKDSLGLASPAYKKILSVLYWPFNHRFVGQLQHNQHPLEFRAGLSRDLEELDEDLA